MNLPVTSIDLKAYRAEDLIALRRRIDDHLELSLDQIDLSKELLVQFKLTRLMLEEVQSDDDISLNHKTGLINSLASLMKQIAEAQAILYSPIRQQKFEAAVVEVFQQHPDQLEAFQAAVEARLSDG